MKENICYSNCNVYLSACGCLTMLEQTCQETQDIEQKITETLLWVKKCILVNPDQLREVLTDPKSHWYLSVWADYFSPSAGLEYMQQLLYPKYNQDLQGAMRYFSKNNILFSMDVLIFLEYILSISMQELHDQPEQLQGLIHTATNRPSLVPCHDQKKKLFSKLNFPFLFNN